MRLDEALEQLAIDLDLSPVMLRHFAEEDTEDGWDWGEGSWGIGSLFSSEGKLLYALVRAMKPQRVLEMGCRFGCSSKHILMALVRNGHGRLVSVDWEPLIDKRRFTRAERKRWRIIRRDVYKARLPKADIVLEDLKHDLDLTRKALMRAYDLGPRLILSHDALHEGVGEKVRLAFWQVLEGMRLVDTFDEPEHPNCGFAYWIRS